VKKAVYFVAALLPAMLSGLSIGNWQNIRFSGKNAASQVLLSTEIEASNLTQNKVIYNPGSGIAEYNLTLQNAATSTYQASIPVGSSRRYLGLKNQAGTGPTRLIPVFYEGKGLPALNQLSRVSSDATKDNGTDHYDIVSDYVSFSDTKLYTAIRNRGGGFPTSGGLGTVYHSYMSLINDPAADRNDPDVIVWALAYMKVALGGISPGLFKITGTGSSDLVRIGDIQTKLLPGSNLLVMSCNLADLLADPDFAAWYDPANPVLAFHTIVNRTTVIPFGTKLQDGSPGGLVYLRKLYCDPN